MADSSMEVESGTALRGMKMVTFLLYERLARKSNSSAWFL